MATIKDIARAANVSTATVSYVLNGNLSKASQATRRKIFKAVEDLGYSPNLVARGFRRQKTETIGVVMGDYSNPFFVEILKGLHDTCVQNKFNIITRFQQNDLDSETFHIQALIDQQVDGLIICPILHSEGLSNAKIKRHRQGLEKILKSKIPLLSIVADFQDIETNYITHDLRSGSAQALEHLLELGHRKIALMTTPHWQTKIHARLEVYQQIMSTHGLLNDCKYIYESALGMKEAREATAAFFKANPEVTALFGYNDLMTMGAIRGLRDLDLRVPEDVSVIGFDDIDEVSFLEKPLTTVHLQKYELGRMAVEHLLREIESGQPAALTQVMLRPRLVVRETCCPPRTA